VFGFRGQHEDIVPYPKKLFHLLPYTRTPDETLVESGPYNRACEITLSYFKPHPSVIFKAKTERQCRFATATEMVDKEIFFP